MDKTVIREIQEALRTVSRDDPRLFPVPVDGIYNRQTAQAIRVFQSLYGLNPTGEVDSATWQELRDQTEDRTQYTAQPVHIFANPTDTLYPGETDELISFVQIMLKSLSTVYDNVGDVPISGIYDHATVNEIRRIQAMHRLEDNGILDIRTWNVLTTLYNNRMDTAKE